ncbi:MAG TPA: urate hydroxylase PuuD, partial [Rhodospirillales bacterium]|nr:urate hydroxylase PuuD [Rhodospirillales bacterium]
MIDIAYADWLELVFRWLHLIAGIAWIGSSFYFIFLDLSLRNSDTLPMGVKGASWNVHGGGFYFMQKYTVAPDTMPEELHWFKWEAYFTWISGFSLMSIIYYWGAESFLIDKEVMDLTQWQAIGISIGAFIAGWVIYDQLCKSPIGKNVVALSTL